MDDSLIQILRAAAALLFVVALMGGLAVILRKFGYGGNGARPGKTLRRLQILESLSVDPKRRLVLIQRDGVQHLVLLGPNQDTVIETGIQTESSDDGHKTPTLSANDLQPF